MMRIDWRSAAGLLVAGFLSAAPVLAPAAQAQAPAVQKIADRPQPALPRGFLDARPILAHFDANPMPTTVRGLLETLRQPDVCGKGAMVMPDEACALVFYKLDDNVTPDRLRPPMIIKAMYRITLPEDLAQTVMVIPDRNGEMKRYVKGDLYEPLRAIRANMCLADSRFPGQCRATGAAGVLYHPVGVLGNRENARLHVVPERAADLLFNVYTKPDYDDAWMAQWGVSTTGLPLGASDGGFEHSATQH